MSNQLAMPVEVNVTEISREKSLGGAIDLCAKAAGFEFDKQLQQTLGVDKAQFSRWQSGQEGIKWPTLRRLMDTCGNHAPVLWMVHELGYDLHAMRQRETELERRLRESQEENAALKRVLMGKAA